MSQPENSLAVTKVQAWAWEAEPIPCPAQAGQALKEDCRCNLIHHHKHSSLYSWTTLLEAVACWAGGLLKTPPCHSPSRRGALHGELPASSPAQGSPLPWGSITQRLARDPRVDRELAVGGERTKTQAAKGTRKWKVRASEWKAER